MKSTHKATQEERVQIARECLETGCNYGETAKKYGVSYQQVRSWTLKYKELGEAGLEDRRGKRKYEQEPRTELEKAQIEIAQFETPITDGPVGESLAKKIGGDREERCLGQVRQIRQYRSIRQCSEEPDSIPVEFGCACLHISRTAYYAWLSGKMSKRDTDNARLCRENRADSYREPG